MKVDWAYSFWEQMELQTKLDLEFCETDIAKNQMELFGETIIK